ncbi:serine/threonine protein kinase [Oscillibacter sp. PC13]|uniref:Stk1 family PASTA domain-containing Ser/Thr kinase n=1 Tax=Oscillibacter sp. PC13 TaxID=1855299 RepID=UPI0008EC336E|nr:Stk1 family PASTA domain-containing Ser/Thr kinase [Oscillibacter sp. PC13]SFP13167.1 serine/threonine protein kinase [Oscillibacter sp. PC13]
MDQYIGKMLDNRYEILERIGTGGMAVVYKAKCHRLNRLVAIKILKSDLAQNEDFRRRFNAESQAVAQLSHPNIVSVYDVSRGGDVEYIVMELIDGITLKQYMEKRGQLNWRESLHFITQIMRGLSHAHSRGIVHRDIKPQNVMVLRDGSVKVADFGIACLENSAQTLTQEALGSVHYISPEQARGDRTDARSDIYSAGVVLYEMLTGRLPFEGDSAVSVAIQHLSSIPLAPREINQEIPEQLELICMKAMAPDLERRYPSADAMIADLEAFRKNPGVNLDFEMEDLRPAEEDEPTRLLRTAGVHAAANAGQSHRSVREREGSYDRERRRNDAYETVSVQSGKRQIAMITGAVVVALVLVFFLFRFILSSFGEKTPEYAVPDLIGMTLEEAENDERVKDIFTINSTEEANDEAPAGEIFWQDPKADTLKKGENLIIEVKVSTGAATGEMLDITNKTYQEAKILMKKLIEDYELTMEEPSEEAWVFSDEVNSGYIISSSPAKGEPLKKGDTITLVISKGPQLEEFPVPFFVGQPIDKVREQLKGPWPLTCTDADIEWVDSDEDEGIITWQSIDGGATAKEGDTIKFKVSNGKGISQGSGSDILTVSLPTDRDSGRIQVYLDGSLVYDDTLVFADWNWTFTREFTGTGSAEATVYIDGELSTSTVLQFS